MGISLEVTSEPEIPENVLMQVSVGFCQGSHDSPFMRMENEFCGTFALTVSSGLQLVSAKFANKIPHTSIFTFTENFMCLYYLIFGNTRLKIFQLCII